MKISRKIVNRFANYLPGWYRVERMRKCVRLKANWPSPSLEIKIAETEQEFESAYRLVHDSYVKAGYMDPDSTGLRILPQNLLPQNATIIAKWDGEVVGTLSLIRDNPLGLPMESIFDVTERRRTGKRLAEVSSLSVDSRFRGQVNNVLFPMFRFGIQYARHCFGVHEFVVATTPALGDTYEGLMCFEKLKAKPRAYGSVKDTVAVGLYLNFETSDERWKKAFAHRPVSANFHKYWTEIPNDQGHQMPKRLYNTAFGPGMTPELLSNFFFEKGQLGGKLTYGEMRVLFDAYPQFEFQKVLLPYRARVANRSVRLETSMKAKLGSRKISAEVLNISREGILLRAQVDSLPIGHRENLGVWLNAETSTSLNVEVCRHPSDGLLGLRIHEPTTDWLKMVATLEREAIKAAPFYPIAA